LDVPFDFLPATSVGLFLDFLPAPQICKGFFGVRRWFFPDTVANESSAAQVCRKTSPFGPPTPPAKNSLGHPGLRPRSAGLRHGSTVGNFNPKTEVGRRVKD